MLRELKEFDDHEMVLTLSDKSTGFKGYISIHSTVLGPALGGTRVQIYQNEKDALRDVLSLSKAMSYKCAHAGLPYGGGKGVVLLEENSNKELVLESYAKMVDKLNGLFKTGTDVGISEGDVVKMARFTDHMLGVKEYDRGDFSTSKVAALGVYVSIRTGIKKLFGYEDLKGRKIAIKGVGKLGGELARLANEAGAELYIADVNETQCRELESNLSNIHVVSVKDIHKQEVDVYAPCALGNEFTDNIIEELSCKAIIGGANNQLPDSQAGTKIYEKGILYAPDYVVNAGGLIYVADELEPGGFNKERVISRTYDIQSTLEDIFNRSVEESLPTHIVADKIAEELIRIRND